MVRDYLAAERQTYARTMGFGGVERDEDLRQSGLHDAAAIVADPETHLPVLVKSTATDGSATPAQAVALNHSEEVRHTYPSTDSTQMAVICRTTAREYLIIRVSEVFCIMRNG